MIKPYYTRLRLQQSPSIPVSRHLVWVLYVYKTPISTESEYSCVSGHLVWVLYVYKTLITTESKCSCVSGHMVWVLYYIQDSDHNVVRVFLYLWTLGLSSLLYTRLWSQQSSSVPVSLEDWFDFYTTFYTILETPPSLGLPDLWRPRLGWPAPLRYLQRKDPEQDLLHPDTVSLI